MSTSAGKFLKIKYRDPQYGTNFFYAADENLAKQLPPLGLPCMSEEARAAFQALLQYEGPCRDAFEFIEARGFSMHPCDWIAKYSLKDGGWHPALYQSWIDWLSEHGSTKFHQGNRLTVNNCKRWDKQQLAWGLSRLITEGRLDNFKALKEFASSQPTSIRTQLLDQLSVWGNYCDYHIWQRPLVEYFLNDSADEVRILASQKLKGMSAFANEEAYAQNIASELTVTADSVRYRNPPADKRMSHHVRQEFIYASFDTLAAALGLAPTELAQRVDLDDTGKQLTAVAAISGDVEVRSIFATRMLDAGKGREHIPLILFKGFTGPLWERGLRAMLASHYVNSVQEYLGDKTGTLSSAMMREWHCYHNVAQTVSAELDHGKLPVNISHDPLRVLGKVVDKQAAAEVLKEALAAGMRPDNPRLTMLKLNLAL